MSCLSISVWLSAFLLRCLTLCLFVSVCLFLWLCLYPCIYICINRYVAPSVSAYLYQCALLCLHPASACSVCRPTRSGLPVSRAVRSCRALGRLASRRLTFARHRSWFHHGPGCDPTLIYSDRNGIKAICLISTEWIRWNKRDGTKEIKASDNPVISPYTRSSTEPF